MSNEYFDKCKKFERGISRKIKQFIVSLCKECPHQQDQHEMNCLECCPLRGVLGKMLKSSQKIT
jgi:hypothetical protein